MEDILQTKKVNRIAEVPVLADCRTNSAVHILKNIMGDNIPDGPTMAIISPGKTSPAQPFRMSFCAGPVLIIRPMPFQVSDCGTKSTFLMEAPFTSAA